MAILPFWKALLKRSPRRRRSHPQTGHSPPWPRARRTEDFGSLSVLNSSIHGRAKPHGGACCFGAACPSHWKLYKRKPMGANPDKRKRVMKKLLLLAFAAFAMVTSFTGCRTAHGAGEDMERAGEKIQDKTDR